MIINEIGCILASDESRVSANLKTALKKMAAALHLAGIHSTAALA